MALNDILALIDASRPARRGWRGRVELLGRPIEVRLTAAALRALAARDRPLCAELELYFSCLIRKRVRFHDAAPGDSPALERLFLRFRPVTTAQCRIDDHPDGPPLEVMPVAEPHRFVPDWLSIDHRRGRWSGEYGYLPRSGHSSTP